MDQFKRSYSNEDTVTKAIPFFWENFDPEGWSIWKCDYKYKDELKNDIYVIKFGQWNVPATGQVV